MQKYSSVCLAFGLIPFATGGDIKMYAMFKEEHDSHAFSHSTIVTLWVMAAVIVAELITIGLIYKGQLHDWKVWQKWMEENEQRKREHRLHSHTKAAELVKPKKFKAKVKIDTNDESYSSGLVEKPLSSSKKSDSQVAESKSKSASGAVKSAVKSSSLGKSKSSNVPKSAQSIKSVNTKSKMSKVVSSINSKSCQSQTSAYQSITSVRSSKIGDKLKQN